MIRQSEGGYRKWITQIYVNHVLTYYVYRLQHIFMHERKRPRVDGHQLADHRDGRRYLWNTFTVLWSAGCNRNGTDEQLASARNVTGWYYYYYHFRVNRVRLRQRGVAVIDVHCADVQQGCRRAGCNRHRHPHFAVGFHVLTDGAVCSASTVTHTHAHTFERAPHDVCSSVVPAAE